MSGMKKVKARDEFVSFVEKQLKAKFGELNQVQQSRALVQFFIKEIHNKLRSEISDDDLELGIMDGAGDLGADFIHCDDGHVTIIQAKYRSQGNKEPPEDISYFQSVIKRIADGSIKASERLLDRIAEIDLKNDTFSLVYVTFGEIANQAKAISQQEPSYPKKFADLDQRCEWEFYDETGLNEEIRNALAVDAGISEKTISLYPQGAKGKRGDPAVVQIRAGEYRSFLMVLDAPQLIRAYKEGGRDSLFSLNIRNFIGKTSTNKAIIATAKDRADTFFLFNNGISCLCKKIEAREDRIDVTGLQIINGAQTIKALVNAAKRRPGDSDVWPKQAPNILARITEIPGGYGAAGKMREEITRFNNTQNVVKISDFRSNDSVQEHLKE